MDGRRFDEFTKALATGASRRTILKSLAGGLGAALAAVTQGRTDAAAQAQAGDSCQTNRDCRNLTCCEGFCRDLLTDRNHCGSCEFGCQGDATCCRGACRDTKTDRNHCGGCLQACPPRDVCLGGMCCLEGSRLIGGECCPPRAICGQVCCAGGEVCVGPAGAAPRCCPARQVCGQTCCPPGQECVGAACCPVRQACNTAAGSVECCGEGSVCVAGVGCCAPGRVCQGRSRQDCCLPTQDCVDGTCRERRAAAPGQARPNLAATFAMPPDHALIAATRVDQAAGLEQIGVAADLAAAVGDAFRGAYSVVSGRTVPGETRFAAGARVGVVAFSEAQPALAFLEGTFFGLEPPFDDLTNVVACGEPVDKNFVIGRRLTVDGAEGLRLHTAFQLGIGAYVGEVILDRLDGPPEPEALCALADGLVQDIRRLLAGEAPDPPGLGGLLPRVAGVAAATAFPARLEGREVPGANESATTVANRAVAHGDAVQVWLSNYLVPGTPYRLFARVWEFASPEVAEDFGRRMPAPLLPTYEGEGIELTAVDAAEIIAGLSAFFFTWPQVGAGHQFLFPLDRYFFSLSVADTTIQAPGDGPAREEAKTKTRDATEELVRGWVEQLERAVSGGRLPFELLPELEVPRAAGGGGQGQCAPEQKKPKPLFVNEEGTLQIAPGMSVCQGDIIDEEDPEPLKCDTESYIYSSFREIVQDCAGFGGAADRDNAVCKSAAEGGQKGAATVPCPTNDCPQRELTEIFRGWECGLDPDDLARTGQLRAICGVQLKLVCRVSL